MRAEARVCAHAFMYARVYVYVCVCERASVCGEGSGLSGL